MVPVPELAEEEAESLRYDCRLAWNMVSAAGRGAVASTSTSMMSAMTRVVDALQGRKIYEEGMSIGEIRRGRWDT
jgi:phospholipid N-methyltransferase